MCRSSERSSARVCPVEGAKRARCSSVPWCADGGAWPIERLVARRHGRRTPTLPSRGGPDARWPPLCGEDAPCRWVGRGAPAAWRQRVVPVAVMACPLALLVVIWRVAGVPCTLAALPARPLWRWGRLVALAPPVSRGRHTEASVAFSVPTMSRRSPHVPRTVWRFPAYVIPRHCQRRPHGSGTGGTTPGSSTAPLCCCL